MVSFQIILRRRPFLIKNLENVVKRLLQQLEHYSADQQDKLAIALALIFSMKLGIPPENLMLVLHNDQLVAKGTMLRFVTNFFKVPPQNSDSWCTNLLLDGSAPYHGMPAEVVFFLPTGDPSVQVAVVLVLDS